MHKCNDDCEEDADRGLADCPSVGLIAIRVERSTASLFACVLVGVDSLRRDLSRCISEFRPRMT